MVALLDHYPTAGRTDEPALTVESLKKKFRAWNEWGHWFTSFPVFDWLATGEAQRYAAPELEIWLPTRHRAKKAARKHE